MKIVIADYLPLANKGEEEIIRGIESLFSKQGDEELNFTVFGDVKNIKQVGNVTVFPKDICYPQFGGNGKLQTLISLVWALLGIVGIYPYSNRLKKERHFLRALHASDRLLIGHDGFFNIRCAQLANYLYRKGYQYGILGAGFNKPGWKIAWAFDPVYKKCFDNARYIVLREKTAYNYVKSISNNPNVWLYPDPAFYCPENKYDEDNINSVLNKYGIINENRIKVGLTVCEDSISFSRAFIGSTDKVESHRLFVVDLLTRISRAYNVVFYFLPHCIKEGKGNDLLIAKDIQKRLDDSVECNIIEEDMPVLDLKCIIAKMDLLIGERTHSIINSISTATPFVSLTCTADFRTHDIVGDGCNLPSQVYDLDNPDIEILFDLIKHTLTEKQILKQELHKLKERHQKLKKELQDIV